VTWYSSKLPGIALEYSLSGAFRDSLGGCTAVGDLRWTGAYGVQADVVARTHCSVELIKIEDIHVSLHLQFVFSILQFQRAINLMCYFVYVGNFREVRVLPNQVSYSTGC
jgi:hypothetical protein